jgi:hypothetical protein
VFGLATLRDLPEIEGLPDRAAAGKGEDDRPMLIGGYDKKK